MEATMNWSFPTPVFRLNGKTLSNDRYSDPSGSTRFNTLDLSFDRPISILGQSKSIQLNPTQSNSIQLNPI